MAQQKNEINFQNKTWQEQHAYRRAEELPRASPVRLMHRRKLHQTFTRKLAILARTSTCWRAVSIQARSLIAQQKAEASFKQNYANLTKMARISACRWCVLCFRGPSPYLYRTTTESWNTLSSKTWHCWPAFRRADEVSRAWAAPLVHTRKLNQTF